MFVCMNVCVCVCMRSILPCGISKYSFKWPFRLLFVCLRCRQAGLCSVGGDSSWLPQSCHTAALCSKTAPSLTRPNSLPFPVCFYIYKCVCVCVCVCVWVWVSFVFYCGFLCCCLFLYACAQQSGNCLYAWHFWSSLRLGSKVMEEFGVFIALDLFCFRNIWHTTEDSICSVCLYC